MPCDCTFAPSQVRLHQICGRFLGCATEERVLDWTVRDDPERRNTGRKYAALDVTGRKIYRRFHISCSRLQVNNAFHETPNMVNISFSNIYDNL